MYQTVLLVLGTSKNYHSMSFTAQCFCAKVTWPHLIAPSCWGKKTVVDMMKRGSTFGELAILFLIPRNPSWNRPHWHPQVQFLASHIISVAFCCFAVSEFKRESTYTILCIPIQDILWTMRTWTISPIYSVHFSGSFKQGYCNLPILAHLEASWA